MRVLGIDPSVRGTGYAVLEWDGRSTRALTWARVSNRPKLPHAACLAEIYRAIQNAIATFQPDHVAIEGVIYVQNSRTAILLGSARGAALAAVGEAGLPVHEYPARLVKKAATGFGGAAKQQVGFMMRALLGLTATPGSDEADALAIALTHTQAFRTLASTAPQPSTKTRK
ncbi:MAG: crossover junction endodeoxyribonuclease RuvC [Candidatus Methylacidiphilales bacterium]